MAGVPFDDRLHAGRLLAEELSTHRIGKDSLVLALTRGGVPVGASVADRLGLPLDVIVVRKLGVPWQPELAMGAIAGSELILDERLIGALNILDRDVQEVAALESAERTRREEFLRHGAPAMNPHGHPVILIDDGLATGTTMRAALRHVRRFQPSRVIVAVPVASSESLELLRHELESASGDELICLAVPNEFSAVGQFYRDFRQVEDKEVQDLLARNRNDRAPRRIRNQ
jgi:predicted phosphoribosyltransferase